MKVSFLVTYYNQKEFVKTSLDSILAIEKPCDWEIVIGDDGSNDGTVDVINNYIKRFPNNIKLYIMPRESGRKYNSVRRASANRLNILEHCTGDLYCTLDGDDFYCDKSFIQEAVEIFEKHNDISVIAFGFQYFENGKFIGETVLPKEFKNKHVEKNTYLKKFYLHAGACVHKKCFDNQRIDFIKRIGYFDDNNIVINSLNYGEMFAVNKVIYAYRQTGQSVYTSMNIIEQAVLNVQGMDADIKLIDGEYRESLIKRYDLSLIMMYIWKNKIIDLLGFEKTLSYEDGCKYLKPSFCYDILNFDSISKERKREIKKYLELNKMFTVKQYLKYILESVKK